MSKTLKSFHSSYTTFAQTCVPPPAYGLNHSADPVEGYRLPGLLGGEELSYPRYTLPHCTYVEGEKMYHPTRLPHILPRERQCHTGNQRAEVAAGHVPARARACV